MNTQIKLTQSLCILGKYPEARAQKIFLQVASALSYLHDHAIIHRDLKAENVFFTGRDEVVVGDFGFATRVDGIEQHLTTFCGSPPYAAPELFVEDHYLGPAVDIWALGILLFFLTTGTMPFRAPTVASLKAAILEGRFSCPASLSPHCQSLISGILRRKSSSRLNMGQIIDHPWLEGCHWPSEDRGYRPYPRLAAENLSDSEKAVFQELSELGVSTQLLRQEMVQGVRSPAIAAYRILLHRTLISNNNAICSRKVSRDLLPKPSPKLSGRPQKSRTCVLL